MIRIRAALLAVLSSAMFASAATTISSLPYNITSPGSYVLGANLTYSVSSSSAIRVQASNVTLDLNGLTLKGGNMSWDTAIRVDRQKNVVIKNGVIANFSYGIGMENAQLDTNHRFQDLRISNVYVGIVLTGLNHVVSNVQIQTNGVGMYLSSKFSLLENVKIVGKSTSGGNGISTWGWNNRIRGCSFSNLGIGVYLDNTEAANAQGNVIEESIFTGNGSGVSQRTTATAMRVGLYRNTFVDNTSNFPSTAAGAATNNTF